MTKEFEQFELDLKTFSGFISADPELKYLDSGSVVIKFALPLKKKKEDDAVWLNCEAWGKIAEFISENYKKSDSITVQGFFKSHEYEGVTYNTLSVKFAQ